MVINKNALHLFYLQSFQLHLTCGRRLLLWHSQLHELLLRPVGKMLFVQHTDELMSIPAGHLTVTQTGTAYRATNGMGPAAEAIMGIPELVFLTPTGFLERIWRQHQHLAGEVLLGAVTNAMLCSEQIQCLHCLAIKVTKPSRTAGWLRTVISAL